MRRDLSNIALSVAISFIKRERELWKENGERDLARKVTKGTVDFLNRIKVLEEGSNLIRTKHPKVAKSSTLIVGARCMDGVVVVADRRTMRGMEYREEKKRDGSFFK